MQIRLKVLIVAEELFSNKFYGHLAVTQNTKVGHFFRCQIWWLLQIFLCVLMKLIVILASDASSWV